MDTRSLSVALLATGNQSIDTKSVDTLAILYYENSTGQVSALLQRFTLDGTPTWIDITSQSSQSLPGDLRKDPDPNLSNTLYESAPNDKFSPPFTIGIAHYLGSVEAIVGARLYSPLHVSIFRTNYYLRVNDSGFETIGDSGPVKPEMTKPNQNNVAIRQSDIATFDAEISLIWINGTQPVSGPDNPPDNSFPFARLASVDSADFSSTFLYHQINDTTFAEEHWDSSSRVWLAPDYITVPDY